MYYYVADEVLRENGCPILHLKIEGHVTKTKNTKKGWKISQERAEVIVKSLVLHGCPEEILHPVGLGSTRPIGTGAVNRRIEVNLMTEEQVPADRL